VLARASHGHGASVTRTTCTVSGLRSGTRVLAVTITRGHRRYAEGTTAVRGRIAGVGLHGVRRLSRGRYLVTIITMNRRHHITVIRRWVTLR
jgi:hypothetical protein